MRGVVSGLMSSIFLQMTCRVNFGSLNCSFFKISGIPFAGLKYDKRRFEYKVRDLFNRSGWVVVRAAASKPVDLVCMRRVHMVLVECTYNREECCVEGGRETG